MSAAEISRAWHAQYGRLYERVIDNAYIVDNSEMDLCAIRTSGYVDEVEIKTTKSDFMADFKKTIVVFYKTPRRYVSQRGYEKKVVKHEFVGTRFYPANRFSFLVDHSIADFAESNLPDGYGLYVYKNDDEDDREPTPYMQFTPLITERVKPKILHKHKTENTRRIIVETLAARYWGIKYSMWHAKEMHQRATA